MPNNYQTKSHANKKSNKNTDVPGTGIKRILLGGVGLLILLLVFTFAQRSGRIAFFTENLLSLVVLVVIAIQSFIYLGQWHAMREQMEQAKEQTRIAGDALIIGSRSYVGVHSVKFDRKTKTVIIWIENTGNVPADGIFVKYEMFLRQTVEWLIWLTQQGYTSTVSNFDSEVFKESFGNIKLFRGNLNFSVGVDLEETLPDAFKAIPLILQGHVIMFVEGRIKYRDGFGEQETAFAFCYDGEDDSWSVYSPINWKVRDAPALTRRIALQHSDLTKLRERAIVQPTKDEESQT